jgi:hypothetical protein
VRLDASGKRDAVSFDAMLAEVEVQRSDCCFATTQSQFDFVADHLT